MDSTHGHFVLPSSAFLPAAFIFPSGAFVLPNAPFSVRSPHRRSAAYHTSESLHLSLPSIFSPYFLLQGCFVRQTFAVMPARHTKKPPHQGRAHRHRLGEGVVCRVFGLCSWIPKEEQPSETPKPTCTRARLQNAATSVAKSV